MINWSWTDLKWDIQRKNSKKNNKRAYAKELIIIIILIQVDRQSESAILWIIIQIINLKSGRPADRICDSLDLKTISMFLWFIIFQTSPVHCLLALDHLICCAIFFCQYNLK